MDVKHSGKHYADAIIITEVIDSIMNYNDPGNSTDFSFLSLAIRIGVVLDTAPPSDTAYQVHDGIRSPPPPKLAI